MKCIAIIPARGGSKGLVDKNITSFLGRPLIQWPILVCKESKYLDDIFVSTDSESIASAAKEVGGFVPFLRDKSFAQDTTTTESTLKKALEQYEQKFGQVDIIVFLTCTEIFRAPEWIDQCIEKLLKSHLLDSAFIGEPTFKNFWKVNQENTFERFDQDMKIHGNRQEKEPSYREDTGLCCATRASILRSGFRLGDNVEIIPNKIFEYNADIHSKIDLDVAEYIYKLYESYSPNKVSFYTRYSK